MFSVISNYLGWEGEAAAGIQFPVWDETHFPYHYLYYNMHHACDRQHNGPSPQRGLCPNSQNLGKCYMYTLINLYNVICQIYSIKNVMLYGKGELRL